MNDKYMARDKYIARLVPPCASVALFAATLVLSPFLPLSTITYVILGGMSVATIVDYVASKFNNKMDRYFEDIGKVIDVQQKRISWKSRYRRILNKKNTIAFILAARGATGGMSSPPCLCWQSIRCGSTIRP